MDKMKRKEGELEGFERENKRLKGELSEAHYTIESGERLRSEIS